MAEGSSTRESGPTWGPFGQEPSDSSTANYWTNAEDKVNITPSLPSIEIHPPVPDPVQCHGSIGFHSSQRGRRGRRAAPPVSGSRYSPYGCHGQKRPQSRVGAGSTSSLPPSKPGDVDTTLAKYLQQMSMGGPSSDEAAQMNTDVEMGGTVPGGSSSTLPTRTSLPRKTESPLCASRESNTDATGGQGPSELDCEENASFDE
ncbi:hypothetical protein BCR39DRAFT_504038 [Naematelia encephala]|uniref:Uncharacterized protein n=1 Tax=Naematelia encephala TaxID=71784 RepID=A0A1Y2BF22_9TREE|nr:hypothetical protein BCR39DRAFT_504038 [Naematelia encephala]